MWHVVLEAGNQKWKGWLSGALCSPQLLHQHIETWQDFQTSCLCMATPRTLLHGEKSLWFKYPQIDSWLLLYEGWWMRGNPKECPAKWNLLPIHLIHIKPIIFVHLLSLDLFFIALQQQGPDNGAATYMKHTSSSGITQPSNWWVSGLLIYLTFTTFRRLIHPSIISSAPHIPN